MRIAIRPDFDGVVCAVLPKDALRIETPILWVEPGDVQKGRFAIDKQDILANLPYASGCAMWFDQHHSNRMDRPIPGFFRMAPSAAGLVYKYYRDNLHRDYAELVHAADKIYSADLTMAEVSCHKAHPYLLFSMTLPGYSRKDTTYWNHLVERLLSQGISAVLNDPLVKDRCDAVIAQNVAYQKLLLEHTRCEASVAITDFRDLVPAPDRNRFLVYALFPQANIHVKLRYDANDPNLLSVRVGHSIFTQSCRVDVGMLLKHYHGGWHYTVGTCRFLRQFADAYVPKILEALIENKPGTFPDAS